MAETPTFLRLETRLCETCQIIFNEWPLPLHEGSQRFNHYGSYLALQSSGEGGCGLCAQFILGFEEIEPWYDHPDYFDLNQVVEDRSDDAKSNDSISSMEVVTPQTGTLGVRGCGDTLKIRLDLYVPFSKDTSLSDAEEYKWSEAKLLCFHFSVFIIPPARQG